MIGVSTAPKTRKSQPARSLGYEGTSPACSTGHFSVRYWPGGSRAGSYPASCTFRSALLLNTVATLVWMVVTTLQVASRPRSYVAVKGHDAASYLNRMVSNEVEELPVGDTCEALLLTPKARIVAPMTVWRRGADDFLLLTEPEAGERLARELLRGRFAAKCEIALEEHRSLVVLGGGLVVNQHNVALPTRDYGVPAVELVDEDAPADASPIGEEELERLRIRARTPRLGRELDDRVMPAEAGLDERAISFTKGCYPGQEPVARLHYRGHPNRGLRVLALEGRRAPAVRRRARRSTARSSAGSRAPCSDPEHGVVALAFVRREVPGDATLELAGRRVTQLPELSRFRTGVRHRFRGIRPATLIRSPRP